MKALFPVIAAALALLGGTGAVAGDKPADAPPAATAAASPQKLDVNRATVAELLAVPGIGPQMAQSIVDLRAKRGSFSSLEELLQVRGIKEKTLKSITPYLSLVVLPSATPTKTR